MLMSVPEDPPLWVYEMYGRNEHVKKKFIFYAILFSTFSGKKCTSSNFFFFSLFFWPKKTSRTSYFFLYSFFVFSFFCCCFFYFFFISYPKKMNNIQHIYWKVIYVHAPLTQMCYNTVESVTFYLCCRYNF